MSIKNPLDSNRHATPLSFFLATNKREVKWLGFIAFFYAAGNIALFVATYYVGKIVDLLSPVPHGAISISLILVVLSVIGYELGFRIGHIAEVFTISRIRAVTKQALFDHVKSLSFGYFADRFSGQIAHKISTTTDGLERMCTNITNVFISEGGGLIAAAVTLAFVNIYLGLFIFVWSILFTIGIIPYARRMNARASEYAEVESKTSGVLVDFFTNIAAVKVYGTERGEKSAHKQILKEKSAYRRFGLLSVLSYNYMGISIILLSLGLIWITILLYNHSLITVGDIAFISGVLLRIFSLTWAMGQGTINFVRDRGEVAQNLKDLIVAPTVIDGDRTGQREEQIAIEYKDVTFGYSHERPILNHFSFSIKAGEKVGIVGLSGAGKTTFANLLLRFFDVQGGAVLINGEDIRELTQEFLRSHISYISQDTSLFHATIAENIAYGALASSRADIERAADRAYAKEFIETLPEGYESIVGERGVKLSGGQRQRIAIARAILADRPVFLLDEATSALDSDSESKIQKGLEKLMEGKTVIAIAHRLSTLSRMDRIIFLEAGQIVEDGTHEALLAKGGKYAQLWQMQAGGFLPDEM